MYFLFFFSIASKVTENKTQTQEHHPDVLGPVSQENSLSKTIESLFVTLKCSNVLTVSDYMAWALLKLVSKNPPEPIQSATPTTLTNVAIAIEPLSTIMYMEHLSKVAKDYKASSNPNWEL